MGSFCGRESYLMGIVEEYIGEFSLIKLEFTSETLHRFVLSVDMYLLIGL